MPNFKSIPHGKIADDTFCVSCPIYLSSHQKLFSGICVFPSKLFLACRRGKTCLYRELTILMVPYYCSIAELFCSYLSINIAMFIGVTFFRRVNPFKPGVLFIGHRQTIIAPDVTPQNAASHPGLFCLLTGNSSKKEKK